MKKLSHFLSTIIILLIAEIGISQPYPNLTIPIDLSESDNAFFDNAGVLTKNIKYEANATQNFMVKVTNPPAGSTQSFYLIVNTTHTHTYPSQAAFEANRSLNDNESIKLRVEQNVAGNIKIWDIEVTTKETFKPNSNFAYVSAIRSIDGEKADDEIFDAFFKFNLNLFKRDNADAFTMAGVEFNFSGADTTSTTKTLEEAMFSLNYWLGTKGRIHELNRAAFLGIGSKIFDRRIYAGGHLGIMEIKGGFFTTYLLAGYYRDLYAEQSPATTDANGDPISGPRSLRNNIYTEFSIQADGLEVPILSDVRLKVGILYPFEGKNQSNATKPTEDDIKHRILLEVPLDKVFKF